jgi:hypothetical protein
MKWFRMYSDALHNPKVQKLHPATFKHWVNLLCLASENEPRGVLPNVEEIAFTLRVKPVEAQGIVEKLTRAGLLDMSPDGRLSVHNWTKRQRDSDDGTTRKQRQRNGIENASDTNKELTGICPETKPETSLPILDTDTDSEREQRIKDSIESFSISDELRAWARLNTPHVNIPALTERWRKTVRDHHYRNPNGLIENAAASWKTAMTDAEKREAKRDTPPTAPIGLATKHGIRYYEDFKLERELHQVQPAATTGSLGPMLSVRSNG